MTLKNRPALPSFQTVKHSPLLRFDLGAPFPTPPACPSPDAGYGSRISCHHGFSAVTINPISHQLQWDEGIFIWAILVWQHLSVSSSSHGTGWHFSTMANSTTGKNKKEKKKKAGEEGNPELQVSSNTSATAFTVWERVGGGACLLCNPSKIFNTTSPNHHRSCSWNQTHLTNNCN